ncbi:MAG: hypothetical protein R6T78_03630, partial [Dehalococcoidales bacterium]
EIGRPASVDARLDQMDGRADVGVGVHVAEVEHGFVVGPARVDGRLVHHVLGRLVDRFVGERLRVLALGVGDDDAAVAGVPVT